MSAAAGEPPDGGESVALFVERKGSVASRGWACFGRRAACRCASCHADLEHHYGVSQVPLPLSLVPRQRDGHVAAAKVTDIALVCVTSSLLSEPPRGRRVCRAVHGTSSRIGVPPHNRCPRDLARLGEGCLSANGNRRIGHARALSANTATASGVGSMLCESFVAQPLSRHRCARPVPACVDGMDSVDSPASARSAKSWHARMEVNAR